MNPRKPVAGISDVGVSSLQLVEKTAAAIAPKAVIGTFASANGGQLTVFGDALDNTVTVGRNAAGQLLVNSGAVPISGGTPTVANTSLIQVFGQAGNDVITIDERNGAMPRANLFGGTGNDILTGGSGGDMLFGQADHDTLFGEGGTDFLFGGSGNDVLTGGDGDDQVFGEAGNDRMVWNLGDDTDLFEGGADIDTAEVNGGDDAEVFAATANGTRLRLDRFDPAPFALDIGTTEKLVVNMNGGDDSFGATGNLAALVSVTVDGGSGNDSINGSNGADLLIGGAGNDFIDGNQGNDIVLLGADDDTFRWKPGDGSDTVEGGDGSDRMMFDGSSANEVFAVSANGGRALFTRDLANVVMDLNDVERIELNALAGADTLVVNDMAGTGVTQVAVSLAGTIGGSVGDAAADVVVLNGGGKGEVIDVFGSGSSAAVLGLAARVDIAAAEDANDSLTINGLEGDDSLTATTVPVGIVKLTLDGGAGNDMLRGSQGADVLIGGVDHDFVSGDNGDDVALLGAGDDVFEWAPGDGNDTVEGGEGNDAIRFFGGNASEYVNLVANGGGALFVRDVDNVTMDLNEVERVEFRSLGGGDNIVVGDLSGTDVNRVEIDLRGPNGGGDGAADTVTANATNGAETVVVSGDAGGVSVSGLQARIDVFQQEVADDRLVVNGQGGDDVLDAKSLEADGIQLTLNGGLGNDLLIGSEGGDQFNGGDGDDVALMGAGDDTFVWNPGDDDDVVEGQAGFDTLRINGASAAETIDISDNGGRAVFFRDLANVTMDLSDTEVIEFNAVGGADVITVNDLSGTDVAAVNLNLAGTNGAGDGAADTVILQGTHGDDVALVLGENGTISVLGLGAVVNITGFEAGLDRLVINGLDGDDVIEASGLAFTALTADGGRGGDILIGGAGDDILIGGEGDDVLIGGGGLDMLDGGPGDDIEIQDGIASTASTFDMPTTSGLLI